MATQGYEAVFVLKETKKKLKVMCAKEGKTFDQKIKELIKRDKDTVKTDKNMSRVFKTPYFKQANK